mgnify:FL=1
MRKALLAVLLLCVGGLAHGRQEIRLWHGMSGALGVELDRLVERYNASQKRYQVLSYFQGPYDEAMAREIRRRGARRAPHVVQVPDAATADMLRSRAAQPLWQVMKQARRPLHAKYLPAVSAHFADAEGRLLGLPFTGTTPVLYYNRDAFRNAQLDPWNQSVQPTPKALKSCN